VDAGGSALLKNLSIHGLMAGKLKYLAHEWLSFEPRTVEREAIRQRKSTHICASYLWICEYLNNSELALFGDFLIFWPEPSNKTLTVQKEKLRNISKWFPMILSSLPARLFINKAQAKADNFQAFF